jgi:dTDP-glucose 4,6-dehydratase
MKTVLVTGGCGFIGSNFIRLLLEARDYRVVNLDKLTYAGNLENLWGLDEKRYQFIRGDIACRDTVTQVLQREKPWAVVNFAAESHVDRSIIDASPFIQTNVTGVQCLLDAVRRSSVERFLQISTDEVYGDKVGQEPSVEEAALAPSSPYAASKAAADLLCKAYRRTYGLPIVITRSSNNYGPYQFPEKLIPLLINNALNGSKLPVYGDGRQVRDWLYVEDNCQGILAVLERASPGSAYNIGGGEERMNLEVVDAVCEAVAQETKVDLLYLRRQVEFVTDRPGHDRRYAVDTSKIRSELGWSPTASFAAGLAQTVRWYLDHRNWTSSVTSGEYRRYYDSVYVQKWIDQGEPTTSPAG